jgi:hypothetical protein
MKQATPEFVQLPDAWRQICFRLGLYSQRTWIDKQELEQRLRDNETGYTMAVQLSIVGRYE